MQQIDIRKIAMEMKSAQDECTQIAPITSRFPDFNIDDAYEVAQFIHGQRLQEGLIPVGRKIGFTNAKLWPIYGVAEPVWGYMYDKTVTQLGGAQAKCSIGKYSEPKIEPEIVLHFCAAPSKEATPLQLLECIDWIAPGFEIVQSHFPDWKFQAADTIADQGLHGALFIGERLTIDQLGDSVIQDIERLEIALSCDSMLCEIGHGKNVLGSPLKAALHLVSILSNQSDTIQIKAGETVTTGTLTTAFTINAGQTWSANLTGDLLPGLNIHFEI